VGLKDLKMGTSPSVITARQNGKSIFGNNPTAVWVDDWDVTDNSKAEKPKVYLDFNTPPLAHVIAMQEAGKPLTDIVSMISNNEAVIAITAEHQQQADEIYSYFANKHTMRRLKGEHISEWMLAVDDLCENRKRIDKESVTILVTLPKFYKENRAVELLMRDYKSVPVDKIQIVENFNEELEFVKKIQRRAANRKHDDYYWKTKNNYLVRVRLDHTGAGSSAWECLSKIGKVRLTATYCHPMRIQGYDFYVLQPNSTMEINIV
jgi:hypothetical protein